MNKELFNLVSVSKSFGSRSVFTKLNFRLGFGEKVNLYGRNGSGKTTLLKILLHLLQHDEGQRFFAGMQLKGNNLSQIQASFCPAHTDGFFNQLDGLQNLRLFSKLKKRTSEELNVILHQFHFLTGLEAALNTTYCSCSQGMKKSLHLVNAFNVNAGVPIVIDEPFLHLDDESCIGLESFLESYSGTCLITSPKKILLKNFREISMESLKNL